MMSKSQIWKLLDVKLSNVKLPKGLKTAVSTAVPYQAYDVISVPSN